MKVCRAFGTAQSKDLFYFADLPHARLSFVVCYLRKSFLKGPLQLKLKKILLTKKLAYGACIMAKSLFLRNSN